ncbi:MAG: pilus assembly protein PilM [Deltaproteobacteria bacterium]|nr:pilus assembly protein PilM [Deltaproteobacteria bacterium]
MHRILGLDASATELRLLALQSGFRGFELQEARRVPLPLEGTASERFKAGAAQLGVTGEDSVAMALPAHLVSSHVFTLPFTDNKRIEQVLPAEVEGAIPFDLSEVVWDFSVLSQANGKSQVLVAVVKRDLLKDQLASWHEAGIDPRVVTFAPLAMAALNERRLIDVASGQTDVVQSEDPAATTPDAGPSTVKDGKEQSFLVLEGGPEQVNLTLHHEGKLELARALMTAEASLWDAALQDPAQVETVLRPILRDLKISLRSRGAQAAPKRVLLGGVIAALPGAAELLSSELNLPVAPLALDPELKFPESEVAPPAAALSLGLALCAQQPRGHLNFRKGEFAFTKDASKARGQIVRVAIAASVLLVLWLGSGIARLSALSSDAAAYDDALCTATKKILNECVTDYRQALSRMQGGGSKAAGIPRVSGSEVLAEVLSHMPENAQPLLEDLEVTTASVRIKGVAESFGQVDQIIAGLKGDKCFGDIKQPRVEKQRDSTKVQFAIDFAYTCAGEGGGA